MDLVSLACEEIGLNLEMESRFEDNSVVNVADLNNFYPAIGMSSNIRGGEKVDRLDLMVPKQLSFYGDLPNTVFTDNDGKQSKIILQNGQSHSPPKPLETSVPIVSWTNPVDHLRSQSVLSKFHRRPRKSEIVNSIQGAPSRKLPELQQKTPKSSQPLLLIPESSVVEVKEDNPFRYLLREEGEGKIAFAFYVMDCWEQQKILFQGDKPEFVKQCSKWWTELPTLYRRQYWAREIDHVKNDRKAKIIGQTWRNSNNDLDGNSKKDCGAENPSLNPKRKLSPETGNSRKKLIKQEHDEEFKCDKNMSAEVKKRTSATSVTSNSSSKTKSNSRQLQKAFSNFQSMHREKVSRDLRGASKMEVKRELGRRWKLLDNHEKMSYSRVMDGLKSDEERSGITVNDEVVSDDHYDPSPSVSHSNLESKDIPREAGKSGDDLKDEFCSEEN